MKLPLAVCIADSVPFRKWLTTEQIKDCIEKKYGAVNLNRLQHILYSMRQARSVRMQAKPMDKIRNMYFFEEISISYLRNAMGKDRPDDIPEWLEKQLKPKVTIPAGVLMAEFNQLLKSARGGHAPAN